MASRLVFPSAVRRSRWARVRGSWRSRVRAMRCRAEFAWRLPPRLSRRRRVLPEDASTGLRAHSAATQASLVSRSGLSPAATSSAAALSGPTPDPLEQLRGVRVDHAGHPSLQVAGLGRQLGDAAGQ
jgi:hypothetical protein